MIKKTFFYIPEKINKTKFGIWIWIWVWVWMWIWIWNSEFRILKTMSWKAYGLPLRKKSFGHLKFLKAIIDVQFSSFSIWKLNCWLLHAYVPTCPCLIATETKYDGYLQQMIRETLLRHIMESREISDQNKGVVQTLKSN